MALQNTLLNLGFLLSLSLLLTSCDEIPPLITDCQTQRVVLIEEFTGVKCVNCPTGSEKLGQLLEQYGEQLAVVSIHTGFFSVPYNNSPEDFSTEAGRNLDALLGPVTAYPSAIINRRVFSSENERPLGVNSWAGYIASELCEEPPFLLQIVNQYDSLTRRLGVEVLISPRTGGKAEARLALSVMLLEDGVIAPQATLQGVNQTYVHKHILRAMLSSVQGNAVYEVGTDLAQRQERFNFTLAEHWQAKSCRIIAFIHHQSPENRTVIQAGQRLVWTE